MTTTTRKTHRSRVLLAAGAVGVLVALVLVLVDAPTAVRTLVCLPLLVGIGGTALSTLLVPEQRRLDGLLRTGLAILLGLALLLLSGLLVALFLRDGTSSTWLVVIAAVLSLTALGAVALRGESTGEGTTRLGSPSWSAVAGVALLALALVLGRTIVPTDDAPPAFTVAAPVAQAPGPAVVAPGASVELPWLLQSAGTLPSDQRLEAFVDGRQVDVNSDVTPVRQGTYSGVASVSAPQVPGLHRVVLVMPLADQRLELVSYVDVRP